MFGVYIYAYIYICSRADPFGRVLRKLNQHTQVARASARYVLNLAARCEPFVCPPPVRLSVDPSEVCRVSQGAKFAPLCMHVRALRLGQV